MAIDRQKVLVPPAAASPTCPRLNPLIPNLPSSFLSTSTPLGLPSLSLLYNARVAQRSDNKMPQNGVIEPSVVKSEESDELSLGSLWEGYRQNFRLKSGAGTGVARILVVTGPQVANTLEQEIMLPPLMLPVAAAAHRSLYVPVDRTAAMSVVPRCHRRT